MIDLGLVLFCLHYRLRPEVSKKFKGLKLLVTVTVKLKNLSGSFENGINLKINFKPDFLNLGMCWFKLKTFRYVIQTIKIELES